MPQPQQLAAMLALVARGWAGEGWAACNQSGRQTAPRGDSEQEGEQAVGSTCRLSHCTVKPGFVVQPAPTAGRRTAHANQATPPTTHLGLGGGRGLGGFGRGGGGRGLGGLGRGGGRGCTGVHERRAAVQNISACAWRGHHCLAAAAHAGAENTAWLLCNQQACTSRLWPSMHCRVIDAQLHSRAGSSDRAQARRRRGRY